MLCLWYLCLKKRIEPRNLWGRFCHTNDFEGQKLKTLAEILKILCIYGKETTFFGQHFPLSLSPEIYVFGICRYNRMGSPWVLFKSNFPVKWPTLMDWKTNGFGNYEKQITKCPDLSEICPPFLSHIMALGWGGGGGGGRLFVECKFGMLHVLESTTFF